VTKARIPKRGTPRLISIELVPTRVRPNPTIAAAIKQYIGLLNSRPPEEQVRRFLATNTYFWNGLVRVNTPVYTKVKLGAEFEVDFVWCDPSSSGAEWHLVEIERPTAKLFTKAAEPSHRLTHAMTQVRDWQNWIVRHSQDADELMPGVYQPMGHIFMGRRSELANPVAKDRLRAINAQQRAHLHVHTLDAFASMAMSVLTWRPSTFLPRAFSERDLRRRVPEDFGWVRSAMGRSREFLRDRKGRDYLGEDDSEPPTIPASVMRTRIRQRRDPR
jgi:hypothetical protein